MATDTLWRTINFALEDPELPVRPAFSQVSSRRKKATDSITKGLSAPEAASHNSTLPTVFT
jgi:hypothetical protein